VDTDEHLEETLQSVNNIDNKPRKENEGNWLHVDEERSLFVRILNKTWK
jgi:hypothetical protein